MTLELISETAGFYKDLIKIINDYLFYNPFTIKRVKYFTKDTDPHAILYEKNWIRRKYIRDLECYVSISKFETTNKNMTCLANDKVTYWNPKYTILKQIMDDMYYAIKIYIIIVNIKNKEYKIIEKEFNYVELFSTVNYYIIYNECLRNNKTCTMINKKTSCWLEFPIDRLTYLNSMSAYYREYIPLWFNGLTCVFKEGYYEVYDKNMKFICSDRFKTNTEKIKKIIGYNNQKKKVAVEIFDSDSYAYTIYTIIITTKN